MRMAWVFLTLILALLSPTVWAQFPMDLPTACDETLQEGLDACVVDLGLKSAADRADLCITLVDITDPDHPKMAEINGDKMMYAASLPKIAILLGAMQRVHDGGLRLDPALRTDLTAMIKFSSNTAATRVLNRVGKEYLADLLMSSRYKLYDEKGHGGLWVGKEYGKSPAFRRDPLFHLSHGATAFQVARFYYLMETGQLVSPEKSRLMKNLMADSGINHKFVKGMRAKDPDARLYRKSGTWRTWHADSALIEKDGRKYIAVGLAESRNGGQWLSRLIAGMDDVIDRLPEPELSTGIPPRAATASGKAVLAN